MNMGGTMADSVRITSPVSVEQDSKERVAYDLMQEIARHEEMDKQEPRRYWLELYNQCLSVVSHSAPPDEIRERPAKPSHSHY
jgi:hypothetical protein